MRRRYAGILFGLLFLMAGGPARAIDEGTVTGTFTVNGQPVALKHAYAHLHDNAEKLLDRPRELRILLTDRAVPRETLRGLVFLPIEDLAMQGKVQGLLFEMDPAKPNHIVVTLLMKPDAPGASLMRTTHFASGAAAKLFERWVFNAQRVVGEIERLSKPDADRPDIGLPRAPESGFSLSFSAPVFNEPRVTADLKGRAARGSPQVRTLTAAATLMAAGNLTGARKLQSARAIRQFDTATKLQGVSDADVVKMMKQGGAEMKKLAPKASRVVVRGDQAVVLLGPGQWVTLLREGGRWKMDL